MSILATFSPSGWVTNPLEQIDHMVAYFFETQAAQSHFHKTTVTSYQKLIADAKSTAELGSSIEATLLVYLNTLFDNVQVDVQVEAADGNINNSELQIVIACSYDAEGKRYTISHAIELLGTQVKKLNRINETGDE